jgi:hypothetical protein
LHPENLETNKMTKRLDQLNPEDALYAACRDFPGGIAALAEKRGCTPEYLYQQLDKDNPRAHIWWGAQLDSFLDVLRAAGTAGWDRPIQALARRHGGVYIALPAVAGAGAEQKDCTKHMLQVLKEFGDFTQAVAEAVEKNGISDAELQRILLEGTETLAAVQGLMSWAEAQNAARKPAHLRVA